MFNKKQKFKLSRFVRGEDYGKQTVTLNHRRIFILPSKKGLGFIFLIFILLLVAFVYNNNLSYILAFLLASIFFVSILHTFKNVAGLKVRTGKTYPAFAGEDVKFDIYLDNPGNVPRMSIQVVNDYQSLATTVDVPEFGTAHVCLHAQSKSRGLLPIGRIVVFCYFPFGLFRCWSPLNFDVDALVYPKPADNSVPFPESAASDTQQGYSKTAHDDYYGLKEYQKGDPVRQIHWQAFAKGYGVFIKEYCGSGNTEVWLSLDNAPGSHIEQRLSILCRWVIEADKTALSYGFDIPGVKLQATRGVEHYRKCLEALARYGN